MNILELVYKVNKVLEGNNVAYPCALVVTEEMAKSLNVKNGDEIMNINICVVD